MASRRRNLILVGIVSAMAAVAMAQQSSPKITVTLGENAYEFQQRTGFSMDYPTKQNDRSTSGGSEQHASATIGLGPLTLSCGDAYLSLAHDLDVVNSGRLFCPISGEPSQVAKLRDRIDASWKWSERTDHMQNPRRAEEYGKDITAGYDYLSNLPMSGTVLAVPLYSWFENSGLYIELKATRHVEQNAALSYELYFSWYPACMSTLLVERWEGESVLLDDAGRAERMQERVNERCARLPQLSSAGELH